MRANVSANLVMCINVDKPIILIHRDAMHSFSTATVRASCSFHCLFLFKVSLGSPYCILCCRGALLCEEVRPLIGYDNQECIALVQMYSEMKSSNCIGTGFKMASHFCRSVQQILWINNNSFSHIQYINWFRVRYRYNFMVSYTISVGAAIQTHGIVQDFLRGTDSTQICLFPVVSKVACKMALLVKKKHKSAFL